jgi:hypothetical protein
MVREYFLQMAQTRTTMPEAIPDDWLKKLHGSRRLALARKCHYETRVNIFKRSNKALELIVALSSSVVASLTLWSLLFPQIVVTYITGAAAAVTAICAVLLPILDLPNKIVENRLPLEAYNRMILQFEELKFQIEVDKSLTVEEFKKIYATVLRTSDKSGPEESKLTKFYNQTVNRNLPEEDWKISYISKKDKFKYKDDQGEQHGIPWK